MISKLEERSYIYIIVTTFPSAQISACQSDPQTQFNLILLLGQYGALIHFFDRKMRMILTHVDVESLIHTIVSTYYQ